MTQANQQALAFIYWLGRQIDRAKARRFFRVGMQGIVAYVFSQTWVIDLLAWVDGAFGFRVTEVQAFLFAITAVNWLLGVIQTAVHRWPIPRAIMAIVMGGDVTPAYLSR